MVCLNTVFGYRRCASGTPVKGLLQQRLCSIHSFRWSISFTPVPGVEAVLLQYLSYIMRGHECDGFIGRVLVSTQCCNSKLFQRLSNALWMLIVKETGASFNPRCTYVIWYLQALQVHKRIPPAIPGCELVQPKLFIPTGLHSKACVTISLRVFCNFSLVFLWYFFVNPLFVLYLMVNIFS